MSSAMFPRKLVPVRIRLWSVPVRSLHWMAAVTIMGSAVLTGSGDRGHDGLGWIALGILLVWHLTRTRRYVAAPALNMVTPVVMGMALSGWLAPGGGVHAGFTLAAAICASWYGATVLFESLRWAELRWLTQA